MLNNSSPVPREDKISKPTTGNGNPICIQFRQGDISPQEIRRVAEYTYVFIHYEPVGSSLNSLKNILVHPMTAGSLHWNDLAPMALVLFVGELDVQVSNPHCVELFDMVFEVPGSLFCLVGGGVERPSGGKPYSHLNVVFE